MNELDGFIDSSKKILEAKLKDLNEYVESLKASSNNLNDAKSFFKNYLINMINMNPSAGNTESSSDEVKEFIDSFTNEIFKISDSGDDITPSGEVVSAILGSTLIADPEAFFGLVSIGADRLADILDDRAKVMSDIATVLNDIGSVSASVPSSWYDSECISRIRESSKALSDAVELMSLISKPGSYRSIDADLYDGINRLIENSIVYLNDNASFNGVVDLCTLTKTLLTLEQRLSDVDKSAAEATLGLCTSIFEYTAADIYPPPIIGSYERIASHALSVVSNARNEMDATIRDGMNSKVPDTINKWIIELTSCLETMKSSTNSYKEAALDDTNPNTIELKSLINDIVAMDQPSFGEIGDPIKEISIYASSIVVSDSRSAELADMIPKTIDAINSDASKSSSIALRIRTSGIPRDVDSAIAIINLIKSFKQDRLHDLILSNAWPLIMNLKGEYSTYIGYMRNAIDNFNTYKGMFNAIFNERDIKNKAAMLYSSIKSISSPFYPAMMDFNSLVTMSVNNIVNNKIPEVKRLLVAIGDFEKEVGDIEKGNIK